MVSTKNMYSTIQALNALKCHFVQGKSSLLNMKFTGSKIYVSNLIYYIFIYIYIYVFIFSS